METTTKSLIPIFIVAIIAITSISYIAISSTSYYNTISPSNGTINIIYEPSDWDKYQQTPYVLEPQPTKIYPITPQPTPTPLYYEALQNPSEPCTETYKKFQFNCMGRTKNESYCDYWLSESRKKCSFMQW